MTQQEKEHFVTLLQRIKNNDLKEILDDYTAGVISLESAISQIENSTSAFYTLMEASENQ